MTVLTGQQIVDRGIVSNIHDPTNAIQPAGVDVTARSVHRFVSPGTLDPLYKRLPDYSFHGFGMLSPGSYLVELGEELKIPKDVVGFMYPRSTLLRSGVDLRTAVWDPGYHGKGQVLMVVHNPVGFDLGMLARVGQIVFHQMAEDTEGYAGSYQGEGLSAD